MKIKNFIVILIAASFFMTLFYAENVRSATSNVNICSLSTGALKTAFDDWGAGTKSGTASYSTFECTQGGTVNSYFKSTPNSFYNKDVSGTSDKSYINLTTFYNYIGTVSIYLTSLVASDADSSANAWLYIYNGSTLIHKMVWTASSGSTTQFKVYDNAGATHNLGSASYPTQCKLVITHLYTNYFNYSIYNFNTGAYIAGIDCAGQDSSTYTNFTRFYVYGSYTGGSAGDYAYLYMDDIILTVGTTGGSISTGDMTGYTAICTGGADYTVNVPNTARLIRTVGWCPFCWTETYTETLQSKYLETQFINPISRTLYAVDLYVGGNQLTLVSDDLSNYFLTVNGNPWGNPDFILPDGSGYKLRWIYEFGTKLENEKPIFEFYSVATSTYDRYWEGVGINPSFGFSLSKYHGTDGYYGNGLFDGYGLGGGTLSICYWYNASLSAPPCPDCEIWMKNYTAKFGNDFIQFLHYDESCYYGLDYNTHPVIIYNLSDSYLEPNSRCFLMEIFKVGSYDPIYFHNINIPDSDDFIQGIEELTDYTFTSTGQYYIKLYNTTNYCSDIDNGSELVGNGGNPSMPITVCSKSSNPPPSGGGVNEGIGNFNFSGLPIFFKLIAALFIIIVLTITPYALALLLSRGKIEVQVPSLIYVAFFFIGIVASILLGFLDAWVFFIILIGLIITFAVLWIQRKGGGEA